MKFVIGVFDVPCHFKRVPKNILQMEMKNDDNETSIILNVDANMDDLKYYAGTSNILKYCDACYDILKYYAGSVEEMRGAT